MVDPPKWDMSVVFPSLDSNEFRASLSALETRTKAVVADFDAKGIEAGTAASDADPANFDQALETLDSLFNDYSTVSAYVYAFVTTDARDEVAQKALGQIEVLGAEMRKLRRRFMTWVGSRAVGALGAARHAAGHVYFIERCRTVETHSMSAAEEALAADMGITASGAFERLHGDVTSQIAVEFVTGGQTRKETMPTLRGLAYDSDRNVRRDAYFAELDAWKRAEIPCAAAMNAIKGEVNLLSGRRGWESPLHVACFEANMDVATLDAMIGAAKASFPELRKYMKAKARVISGQDALDWFDLFAPMGQAESAWDWTSGSRFVVEQFGTYSGKLAGFAQRAIDERWIDAAPAPAKRDGAFCMGLRKDESRLLQTWKDSFGAVSTLAHELGHGYHNLCLFGRTVFQQETPMTLAETASIFCEQIISQAAQKAATGDELLALVEHSLQRDVQVVVDITSRFLFEQEVFGRRAKTTLSPQELCDIMSWAQDETYGDGLSANRHPYMWAVKPHYYSTESYYNFPYMFGLLFSLGLYAQYQADPEAFRSKYDDLLSSTGLADAATLAQGFGFDIRQGAFWEGSLNVIVEQARLFESLVN